MSPERYSPHFTKAELRASQTAARLGIDNTPPPTADLYLAHLCETLLEPIRALLGPVQVSSGYRCPEVNFAVGGAKNSAHVEGRAADWTAGLALGDAMDAVIASGLPFDQIIYEFGHWLHVAIARHREKPRREALMVFKPGAYLPYDPKDPRIQRG